MEAQKFDGKAASGTATEGIMGTTIFSILCIAAEGFMLYCLFHFGQELRQESLRRSAAGQWVAWPRLNVMTLQFVAHTRVIVWSDGTWNCLLSSAHSELRLGRSKVATNNHYDMAA